jgi:hypothetical protein
MAMNDFLSHLFRRDRSSAVVRRRDRAYVSEFTKFINQYLDEHPEVVEDQWVGRSLLWDRKIDYREVAKAKEEEVPDDNYGFSLSSWAANGRRRSPPDEN